MSAVTRPPLAFRAVAHAVVYGLAAVMIAPFAWMVMTALKTDSEAVAAEPNLLPAGAPSSWRWEAFREAWIQADLGPVYLNSALVAIAVTVLSVAHNALAGFAFAKLHFAGRRIGFGIVLSALLLPYQVWFLFAYVLCGRLGYIDRLQVLIVPFLASAFGIFYMRQAIRSVPDALLEAGRVDGFGDLGLFVTIVAPAVRPALAALAVFTFMASWNDFFWPLVAIDSNENFTLPLAVAALSSGLYVQSWPVQMAAATLITIPSMVVFVIFQRWIVRGVAMTGAER